jgi:hypothetical protein
MEAVTRAGLQTTDGLVTKSLLVRRRNVNGPSRLHMLETIRAYAVDKLAERADGDEARERHFRHFLALAQRHGDERILMGTGRREQTRRLDAEIDNLHAALAWTVERRDAQAALELCVALDHYWLMSTRYVEAVNWIDQALDLPGAQAHGALRVHALCTKALALWPLWRSADVRAAAAEAESVARALGDRLILSEALQVRARVEATDEGTIDFAPSVAMAEEALALAVEADDEWATAKAAYAAAIAAETLDDLHRFTARAADLLAETGNLYHLARILAASAYNGLCVGGSDADAKRYADRAADLLPEMDDPQSRAFLLVNIGLVSLLAGDTDAADAALQSHLGLGPDQLTARYARDAFRGVAALAAVRNDDERCARLVGAAAAHGFADALPDPVAIRLDIEFFGPARARLGPDAWTHATRDGASLSLEAAIAYALQTPPPRTRSRA